MPPSAHRGGRWRRRARTGVTEWTAALGYLGALRRAPMPRRILVALVIAAAFFALRVLVQPAYGVIGRDLLLIGIVLSAVLLGLLPGLVMAAAVRGASLWWFTGPPEVTFVRPWDDPGTTFFIIVTTLGGALAGDAARAMARRDEDEG